MLQSRLQAAVRMVGDERVDNCREKVREDPLRHENELVLCATAHVV